jgi:hypothetical protein
MAPNHTAQQKPVGPLQIDPPPPDRDDSQPSPPNHAASERHAPPAAQHPANQITGQIDQSPLEPIHWAAIRAAAAARRRLQRAVTTAKTSAIVILSIGLLALAVSAAQADAASTLMSLCVSAIGATEYYGYLQLRKMRPGAALLLALNQTVFCTIIVLYCVAAISGFNTTSLDSAISPQLRQALGQTSSGAPDLTQQIGHVAELATYALYGLIIILTLAFQGGLAAYYFTRRPLFQAYHAQTPTWIRQLLAEVFG